MTGATLPSEREAEIRAHARRADASELVDAAATIRRVLLESGAAAPRPDLGALLAARAAPTRSRPRARVLVGVGAALVAAGSIAAAMAGVLPAPLQDSLHRGGDVVGIHLPASDEMREIEIIEAPSHRPLWDDGRHGDVPADGHAHEV